MTVSNRLRCGFTGPKREEPWETNPDINILIKRCYAMASHPRCLAKLRLGDRSMIENPMDGYTQHMLYPTNPVE